MEHPLLQDLWSEIYAEMGEDVVCLCIDLGDTPETIMKYWEKNNFTMDPVMDEGTEASLAYGVLGYPTNYVIGPDGKVRYAAQGWDANGLRKAVLGK